MAVELEQKEGEKERKRRGVFVILTVFFLRGFTRSTPPTTPDRHVPNGSAPRGCSRVLLLSAESCVLFRGYLFIFNAIKTHKTPIIEQQQREPLREPKINCAGQ